MARIISVIVVSAILFSLFFGMMPAASSEEITTLLDISFPWMRSDIVVHLLYVEVSDHQKGNTYTATPLDEVNWFRLFYKFENKGDHGEDGYLKVEFLDKWDNVYKPNDGTYTGDTVSAGSMGSLKFIEVPIPKDVKIVKIRTIQGFEPTEYYIPQMSGSTPTPEPTVAPTSIPLTTVSATTQATGSNSGSCLPLLPFAILCTVGLAGLATGKRPAKK